MRECRYDIHGVDVAVVSDDHVVLGLVDDRLRSFRRDPGPDVAAVRLSFAAVADTRPYQDHSQGHGRPVYDPPEGDIVYYDDRDQLHMNDDQVTTRVDLAAGSVETWFRHDDPSARWRASHPFLTLALMELLRRRRRYCLHAAACVVDGHIVLIAGPSGAGKSTLSLALVRAGAGFLGDDTVFLSPSPQGLTVLGFPDEIDLTDETAEMFPELAHLVGQPKMAGAKKHRVRAEEAFGDVVVMSGPPAVLVFPTITGGEDGRTTPMAQSDALLELVPNVLLTDPPTAQAHLDALGRLVESCRCFRLATGRRIQQVPDLVFGLLEKL